MPDGNTLYAVHFAPGINITGSDGSKSCQVFCAYHGSYSKNGTNVYYSIVPDQGGSCAGGCGNDPSTFNNTTSVASHELVEATTDADVAQNNLAWYDDTQRRDRRHLQCAARHGGQLHHPKRVVEQEQQLHRDRPERRRQRLLPSARADDGDGARGRYDDRDADLDQGQRHRPTP